MTTAPVPDRIADLQEPPATMRAARENPLLYQVNTRVYLTRLSAQLGRVASLDDIPDQLLDWLRDYGFDWVWFLGIWQTGEAGRQVSRAKPEWRHEFRELLPDLTEEDICGSCFAITGYDVHADFGGNDALERLRRRLHVRGIRLLLDFVPNHTARDHTWVSEHPEFYVHGTEDQLRSHPQNYQRVGSRILAYGRDPYFDGWPDTFQLNYANADLREAMCRLLERLATMCDGVRCDMAMLVLPDIFERTWGMQAAPFWPEATARAKAVQPGFLFMAEVYWDLEWTLQQQGFDETYDKRLYDRLREGQVGPVRDHLKADLEFQRRSTRFLENHDEPRAAATFDADRHEAAAIVTYLSPGLRFFHQGQLEGFRKHIPVHLRRGPEERADPRIQGFYRRLLLTLQGPEFHGGRWQLLDCLPAWEGNWTSDCFICFGWRGPGSGSVVVAVNFAPNQSQCYTLMPGAAQSSSASNPTDLMPLPVERQDGSTTSSGRYVRLDLPAWGYKVLRFTHSETA